MIGPPPTDPLAESVEQVLWDLLRSALAGTTPPAEDADHDNAPDVRGLGTRKYHVLRLDGSDKPGEKHHECALFTLDLTHDAAARTALIAYCAAARVHRPHLVQDLINRYLSE